LRPGFTQGLRPGRRTTMQKIIRALSLTCLCLSLLAETPRQAASGERQQDYTLGAGDVLTVWALELDEFNQKPFRIDASGFVNLPLVGRSEAAGLTVSQLEN